MIIKLNKLADLSKWHQWFAWHPIVTEERELVWLCWVFRRGPNNWAHWVYTFKPKLQKAGPPVPKIGPLHRPPSGPCSGTLPRSIGGWW